MVEKVVLAKMNARLNIKDREKAEDWIKRSTRINKGHRPKWYSDDVESDDKEEIGDPNTIDEAFYSSNRWKWIIAIYEDMIAMKENKAEVYGHTCSKCG